MKRNSWTVEEQAYFLKRTGELLGRGYPLTEAIESLIFYLPEKKQKQIQNCLAELKEGYPLFQILAGLHFHKDLVGYVFFAEQHGGLAAAFQDASEIMLKRNKDLQRLLKLLYYPAVLIFITIVLFFFVENLLLPKFITLFRSMNLEENFFTQVVYLFGKLLPLFLAGVIIVSASTFLYHFVFFRKKTPLEQKKKLILLPYVGPLLKMLYSHYFSVQLSYLLSGGLSIFEALHLFEQNSQQPLYKQAGAEIKRKLIGGERLETILASLPIFEKELATIIKHGQENGRLDKELYFYSRFCLERLEALTEKTLKILQPLLYLLIGLLIVSMYLAVLLPMFHLLDGI
ncbi:competence type IV pilus assembly protein ComGB [Bacillus canaveralius]|uniref:competence type IV pilus assembly protein ComGB n=1 Tax=Bacillus canaveralius TaxID=1403243 RepID=UPI000F77A6DA|nr:competence type IV pilus assembly protein ComGB [Bacillus canaveralius]RSK53413.1 type II secretion system F family protein [Bacillus canaveralius]